MKSGAMIVAVVCVGCLVALMAGRGLSAASPAGPATRATGGAAGAAGRGTPPPNEPAKEKDHPKSIYLWPDGAPGSEAHKGEAEVVNWRVEPDITFPVTTNIHNPSITLYLPPKEKSTGVAVIIAPGGGHMFLTMDREGYDLGEWLAQHGVAGVVLKYRLARQTPSVGYKVDVEALANAQRAIRTVRSHAAEWNIDPAKVGIIGFSAGGEVSNLAAAKPSKGNAESPDPIERIDAKPNFCGLVYGLSRDASLITKDLPPTFLLVAQDDGVSAAIAERFGALKAVGVNAELHIYDKGGHGFGVRQRPMSVTSWPNRFVDWLNDRDFIKQP